MRKYALKKKWLCLAVVGLCLGLIAEAAHAQGNVCLRSRDIYNWDIIDDKTLIVTDRRDDQYKLELVGTCAGLQQTRFSLAFESLSELSCLRPGDSIRYNDPAFGHERCTISAIKSYVANEADSDQAETGEGEG